MSIIWRSDSPLARCRACGVQQQFHSNTGIAHAHERDHAFEAETIADFEPGDLTPAQLVSEIFARPNTPRAAACGAELRIRIKDSLGVACDDLLEALS